MSTRPLLERRWDHPEIGLLEELVQEAMKQYKTMICCLQWAVSRTIFDIQTATMTISQFRVSPEQGHLDRLKCMYDYLKQFSSAAIHMRAAIPNLHNLPNQDFGWCHTMYGKIEELL